uniref:GxxExxY protein n=1 Tax=candidate division WOR-3 bacterium TaxID=2052148 RepID=A0A7V0Z676_UNCW3
MHSDKLLHKDLTYKIIGILFKVHKTLGCGFPEKVYQRAIEIELNEQKISYEKEKVINVKYNNKIIGKFRLDLVIDGKVILELKAVEFLSKVFREQLISQLKASPYEVGLLVNFGSPELEYIRLVRSKYV